MSTEQYPCLLHDSLWLKSKPTLLDVCGQTDKVSHLQPTTCCRIETHNGRQWAINENFMQFIPLELAQRLTCHFNFSPPYGQYLITHQFHMQTCKFVYLHKYCIFVLLAAISCNGLHHQTSETLSYQSAVVYHLKFKKKCWISYKYQVNVEEWWWVQHSHSYE